MRIASLILTVALTAAAAVHSEASGPRRALPWCLPSTDPVATRLVWHLQGIASRQDSTTIQLRIALANMPVTPDSQISMVTDEELCRQASVALDSSFFEPARQSPVYLARVGTRYVAHPPSIGTGEFGYLVHLDSAFTMLVASLW